MMIFYLLILVLAIPTGFVIAKLAHDELIDGFIYIKLLTEISFVFMMVFSFYDEVITVSLGFIIIVSYISLLKRYDKRWAKPRNR
ncbi:hypothetical protein FJZ21_01345 [Candidatus Pacearchaeota archaeon]|nr:hypothetical protein [Candidatus Pacearchaeota archaeon]